MIGDIYRSAARVLVWLGVESVIVPADSDELKDPDVEMPDFEKHSQEGLLDCIRLMAADLMEHRELVTQTFRESLVLVKEIKTKEGETEDEQKVEEWMKTMHSQTRAMLSLLAKKMEQLFLVGYWKRMWVVQEYLLAREITLQTDRSQMDGFELQFFFEMTTMEIAMDHRLCKSVPDSPMATQMMVPALSETSLGELIGKFADWRCTDPRDHVYALLSLMNPEDPGYGELVPDYSKSELELYIELAHAQVKRVRLARQGRIGWRILHEHAATFAQVLGIDPEVGESVYREVQRLITRDKESGHCSSAKEVADEIFRLDVQPPSPTTEWLRYDEIMSRLNRHYASDAGDLQESDEDHVWASSSESEDCYIGDRRRRRRERAEQRRQEKVKWEEELKPQWEKAKLHWERRLHGELKESL